MAAGEDQPQTIVADTVGTDTVVGAIALVVRVGPHCHLLQLGRPDRRPAQSIDGAIARGRREPRARIAGNTVTAPSVERNREGVLHALFCEIPITGDADQRRDDATPLIAKGAAGGGLDVV
jgi:hypothetical protein